MYEKLRLLSKYRTELMGIAAIWVILFHLPLDIYPFNLIKDMGYIGVDIFFLVSGFGIYFAYNKSCEKCNRKFYSKRFKKIIPEYILFMLVFCTTFMMLRYGGVQGVLEAMNAFSFWIELESYRWYIPAVLLCYTCTPFLDKYCTKIQYKMIGIVFLLILLIFFSTIGFGSSTMLIVLIRLPIYVIGYYLGYLYDRFEQKESASKENMLINLFLLIISCFAFVVFYLVIYKTSELLRWEYGMWWYPCIIFTVPLCLGIVSILEVLHKGKNILRFFGNISYEVYLFHPFILELFDLYIDMNECNRIVKFLLNVVSIVLGVLIACFYKKLFERFDKTKRVNNICF